MCVKFAANQNEFDFRIFKMLNQRRKIKTERKIG